MLCPSSVRALSIARSHNGFISPSAGSYIGFKTKKLDKSYLPLWLQVRVHMCVCGGGGEL